MNKRVVVGIDDPRSGRTLLEWTQQFCADLDARVDVVHVVPRTLLLGISSIQLDSNAYLRQIQAQLERDVVAPLRRAGITAAARILRGDVAHELGQFAAEHGADFVAVAGGGHGALRDALGTAHRLEHISEVPVVVVPHHTVGAHGRG